ncbi:NmrA family transcriptional regulator [Asanoa iriomotensis]|uniref:NmrA family transcriptional regulator n=1 Tax=Asanoa iriomotensis TaxID=234613 RepID=A0ABQ4BTX8_9ACTN|nr:NmrA family transcriptional regulator [Asanoa iriomotensis]GIF53987.1 NmrA family transcriptional regulator [Asanoa iriomotensis]
MTENPILVIGGTGKTGRRVVERLTGLGVPVRVGSRSGSPRFDWQDRSTWAPALAGVRAAYVTYYPDLAVPGSPAVIGDLAGTAASAGLDHLVLLSGRGEDEALASEQALIDAVAGTSTAWTVVRASWFMQNFSEAFMADGVREGTVVLPAAEVPEPFVDCDDIADVAVAALTGATPSGRVYEVTGPRAVTFAEAVQEIAKASGRDVAFVPVPVDAYAATLREYQLPEEEIALITYLFGEVLDGRNVAVTTGIREALGREPRDIADYARATAATGAWAS